MKKCFYLLFYGIGLLGCKQEQAKSFSDLHQKPQLNYTKYTDSTLYPNGGSELAILMREMYDDMDSLKKLILQGKPPVDIRTKFAYLHNATPTDSSTKKANYPDMAQVFMENLDKFYQEKDKRKRIQLYKVVVHTCISCHQTHCTDVVKKIKKLQITD